MIHKEKYNEFVKWVQKEYPETEPWTGNAAKFMEQLVDFAESNHEFKQRMSEIGPKEKFFKLVYRFYKDNK